MAPTPPPLSTSGVNLFLLFVHVGQFYFPASLYYSGYVLTTGQNLVTRELLRT